MRVVLSPGLATPMRSVSLGRVGVLRQGPPACSPVGPTSTGTQGEAPRGNPHSCAPGVVRARGDAPSGGLSWTCVEGCGACCLLDKGPLAPPIEDILTNPEEFEQYKSMVGSDGWCKKYDKATRKCTIYEDRPRFCRVEPSVFRDLYGVSESGLARTARQFCLESIGDVYGESSEEMKKFKDANPKKNKKRSFKDK